MDKELIRAATIVVCFIIVGAFGSCAHSKAVIAGADDPMLAACAIAEAGDGTAGPICFTR